MAKRPVPRTTIWREGSKQRHVEAWDDPITGQWRVELRFTVAAGRWELAGLQVDRLAADLAADEPPDRQPVTSSLLRRLPLSRFIADWRSYRRQSNQDAVASGAVWVTQQGERIEDEAALDLLNMQSGALDRQRAGRPTFWGHKELLEVARVYSSAWEIGEHPTAAVATHFHKSPSMAAKLVAMTRRSGLLPKTSQGRGGLRRPGRETP